MRRCALLLLALAAACSIVGQGAMPAALSGVSSAPTRAQVAAAKRRAETGDPLGALAHLAAMGDAEGCIERERLRQDLLRQRGRLPELRAEAQARVERQPGSAAARYLLGRLLPEGDAMRQAFLAAVELDPALLWPWLGLAYSLRATDPEQALEIYARLHARTDGVEEVAAAYASALRGAGQLAAAAGVYERMVEQGGHGLGLGSLGLAQTLLAMGGKPQLAKGWQSLLVALQERPFDPAVQSLVADLLRAGLGEDQIEAVVDVLRRDPERMAQAASGAGLEPLVEALVRRERPQAAVAAVETAMASYRADPTRRAPPASVRARVRRLHLSMGDVPAFRSALQADLPWDQIDVEDNQVRALWRALSDAPPGDPLVEPGSAVAFVRALAQAGLLHEAERAADLAWRRLGPVAELMQLRDEVQREVAFENEFRRLLYRGYGGDGAADLDQLLRQVRAAAVAALGHDVVDPDVRITAPFVGELVDPFRSGLGRRFARYNRHLILGSRSGGRPEGLVFTRLALRDLREQPELPAPGRCLEVLGIDRSVRSLSGVLGSDIAGIALLNHYVLDFDAAVEWGQSIARQRAVVAEDRFAALGVDAGGASEPLDPVGVEFRLAAASSLVDTDLVAAVLDVVRTHERRHLVDSALYLPFEDHVLAALSLLLQHGFSPLAIESEMERRAELAALAWSPFPEVVLAHIAEFVDAGESRSPHVRGFTQLAADLVAELPRHGASTADAAVGRWHLLPRETVWAAARALMQRLP